MVPSVTPCTRPELELGTHRHIRHERALFPQTQQVLVDVRRVFRLGLGRVGREVDLRVFRLRLGRGGREVDRGSRLKRDHSAQVWDVITRFQVACGLSSPLATHSFGERQREIGGRAMDNEGPDDENTSV